MAGVCPSGGPTCYRIYFETSSSTVNNLAVPIIFNHGRSYPSQQKDSREEANKEVRSSSVGSIHPNS
ncbi:hypothetical protein IV203_037205 [Nitzschia inconspicua]|uniref:Uncharacterized protein n=1 Tax=Nitzschia inconspicua TaxID=303405 RepID=A0A9K3PY36_9STRA|nr:hypothetical protein IV203_037205 [Nitzschia inconspicua]